MPSRSWYCVRFPLSASFNSPSSTSWPIAVHLVTPTPPHHHIAVALRCPPRFRAQVEHRAKLERERRQRCAEDERRAKYGPLSCTADDVGVTVIRHQNLRGVEISEVAAGSLAEKAGLVATDVIVEV